LIETTNRTPQKWNDPPEEYHRKMPEDEGVPQVGASFARVASTLVDEHGHPAIVRHGFERDRSQRFT
jgi:hypothetical protein